MSEEDTQFLKRKKEKIVILAREVKIIYDYYFGIRLCRKKEPYFMINKPQFASKYFECRMCPHLTTMGVCLLASDIVENE